MIKIIDLSNAPTNIISFYSDLEAKLYSSDGKKGWSFSYVYHFIELKNVWIAIKIFGYTTIKEFTNKCKKNHLPFVKTSWDERRILEQVNALKNFNLITINGQIDRNYFAEIEFTNKISDKDMVLFKNIFHKYFRFKEMLSLFINKLPTNLVSKRKLETESSPLYIFGHNTRFFNSIIYSLESKTQIHRIANENGDVMRFWDVFFKWGQALDLIEKFNLKSLDFEIKGINSGLVCAYYVNNQKLEFNLLEFIKNKYEGKKIYTPLLIFELAITFRAKIHELKNYVIKEALIHSEIITMQRTSEIFLKGKENFFLPKHNNSYISHFILR